MEIKNELYKMRDISYTKGLQDLISYINNNKPTQNMSMIEIGSYAGESTEIFSKYFNNVIAIDPFNNNYDENDITCKYMELTKVYETFIKIVKKHHNINHIRKTSDEAIYELKNTQVDFVYIDGLHTYEQIKKDITNYLPLINKGGFIGGHDYHQTWQGVKDGIHETIGLPEQIFQDTSWIKQIK
jgi:predicted O-methyltransferase YrrM